MSIGFVLLAALVAIVVRPWRVAGKLKATTNESAASFAGGLDLAGLSLSAAAVLGGPGVVALHLGKRELWRRPISATTAAAFFDWLDEVLSRPAAKKGALGRLVERTKSALLARTDVSDLPEAGLRVLFGVRDVELEGWIVCGFADPALTGKAAAWLFPIAGVLAPFGTLDVSFDWSGRTRIDGEMDVSFRFVPAKVARELFRFALHHVHLRTTKRLRAASSTTPALP
jgi:hypothetical protein